MRSARETSRWWATRGIANTCAAAGKQFAVDEDKIEEEARYDGKWVLDDHMDLLPRSGAEVKQLWMVEDVFRSMKSLLDTRPIYHKCDERFAGSILFVSALL